MRNPDKDKGNGSKKSVDAPPRTVGKFTKQITKLGDHKPSDNGPKKK